MNEAYNRLINLDNTINEVYCLDKVKSPYIMRLIENKIINDNLYLVCEYIDGFPLNNILDKST